MAITITTTETGLVIFSEVSDAATLLSFVAPVVASDARDRRDFRIVQVLVQYTAAVTLTVTISLDSGLGAAFDTILQGPSLVAARSVLWIPDGEGFYLGSDDALIVSAPSGGGVIVSRVVMYAR